MSAHLPSDEHSGDHKALLQQYNPDGKTWPSIPDDGYLYDHLAYHLFEAGQLDQLYQLLIGSSDWMETRTTQSARGPASYLADLDLAISCFPHPAQSSDLLLLIQLHTARHVARTQNSIIDDSRSGNSGMSIKDQMLMERDFRLDVVAITLTEIGHNTKATACAATIEDDDLQSSAIEKIVDILLKKQRFTAATQTIPLIRNEQGRNWMRSQLVAELARFKHFDDAEAVINAVTDDRLKIKSLSSLAQFLFHNNQQALAQTKCTAAEKIARTIQRPKMHSRALRDLAGGLAQATRFDRAIETATHIRREKERSEALGLIAVALAKAGQAHEALMITEGIQNANQRENALTQLLDTYLEIGQFEQAHEALSSIPSEIGRWWSLHSLALKLTRAGRFAKAQQILDQLDPDWSPRYDVTKELTSALVQAGQAAIAINIAQGIEDENWRVYVLNELVVALAHSQQNHLFEKVIAQLRQIIEATSEAEVKNTQLYFLAVTLVRSGRFDNAQPLINQLHGSRALEDDWNTLPNTLAEMGQWHEAMEHVVVKDPVDYLRILSSWMPYFERVEAQFTLKILREATRIVSWILPNWREIHTILAEPHTD